MTLYKVKAKVDQIVTREIHLTINAGSEEEAEDKARSALLEFPDKPVTDPSIKKVLCVNQTHWIPKSIDISIQPQEKKEPKIDG